MNYVFQSERLGFRFWKQDDLPVFAAMNADKMVMSHFPSILSKAESQEFLDRLLVHQQKWGYCYFAVELLATKEFIGFIGLANPKYEAEFMPATDVGWRLIKLAWGKGYATEGAKRCMQYAFEELKLPKVVSTCPATNLLSERVMQKIGMRKMGEFLHPKLKDYPELENCIWYEIKKGLD
jgi:RimJ/RimL family protein N-acetyltransferase